MSRASDEPRSNRAAFHFRFQILGEANSRNFPGQMDVFIYFFFPSRLETLRPFALKVGQQKTKRVLDAGIKHFQNLNYKV